MNLQLSFHFIHTDRMTLHHPKQKAHLTPPGHFLAPGENYRKPSLICKNILSNFVYDLI